MRHICGGCATRYDSDKIRTGQRHRQCPVSPAGKWKISGCPRGEQRRQRRSVP